jgi:endonuclease-3
MKPTAARSSKPDATRALVDAKRAAEIFDRLDAQHPNATTELVFHTPFELLVATILSAQ